MIFQVLDFKEKNFLDLNNNNNLSTRLIYSKNSAWFKYFEYFNTLCVHTVGIITSYTLISKYYLRFFSKKFFACLYEN